MKIWGWSHLAVVVVGLLVWLVYSLTRPGLEWAPETLPSLEQPWGPRFAGGEHADGVLLHATGEGAQLAYIESDGDVRWALRSPSLLPSSVADGLMLVASSASGTRRTAVVRVEDGAELGVIDQPGDGASQPLPRFEAVVGRWRLAHSLDRRIWIGPREERDKLMELLRPFHLPGSFFHAPIELADGWVVVEEGGLSNWRVTPLSHGLRLVQFEAPRRGAVVSGDTGERHVIITDDLTVRDIADKPVRVGSGDRLLSLDWKGRFEWSTPLWPSSTPIVWHMAEALPIPREIAFAVGSNERAWVFSDPESDADGEPPGDTQVRRSRAVLFDFERGEVVAEVAGRTWSGASLSNLRFLRSPWLAVAPDPTSPEPAGAPVVVDDGDAGVLCLSWDGTVGRLDVEPAPDTGAQGVVWLQQVGRFAALQWPWELVVVDAHTCTIKSRQRQARFDFGALGRDDLWYVTHDAVWRLPLRGSQAPERVIER